MKVAIIVLNYNTKDSLSECLSSISNLKKDRHEINVFVVDNASWDGSQEEIKNLKIKIKNLEFIQNNKNLGYAGGNNVGIKKALKDGADAVLILNPDTKVDGNLILELTHTAKRNVNVGILAPKIYFYPGFEFHKERYQKEEGGKIIWYAGGKINWANVLASHRGVDEVDYGQYEGVEETDFATGAAMFVKSEVFEKIGFFNEDYFLYLEDLEFCVRAQKAGFKILYVPKAIVWHKWAQAAKGGSNLQDYFITRNRLLFGLKYAPTRSKVALVRQAVSFLFDGQSKRQAVFDFFTHRFGQGSFQIK